MSWRLWCAVLLVGLGLSGCATGALSDFRVSVGLISPYQAAEEAFKRGDVMEARKRLVSIPKDDPDYAKARRFLNTKVDPARLKLLRYYARKGKREEQDGHWAQAEEAYKTAAGLSRSPKALLEYQKNMNLKTRELRFQTLYEQRLLEDKTWLQWLDNYTPPRGLLGNDPSFALAREDLAEVLEYRVDHALWLANKHKKMDLPEIAWVYADSYLRFKPDSEKAKKMKQDMVSRLPKGFQLAKLVDQLRSHVKTSEKKKRPVRRKPMQKVTKAKVEALMKKKDWAKAKRAALALRRQGSPDADRLLKTIDYKTASLAAKAYEQGNIAFRQEHIDEAVAYWEKAVQWMPDEQLYVDTLRRGRRIQERLSALKREESPDEKANSIEE